MIRTPLPVLVLFAFMLPLSSIADTADMLGLRQAPISERYIKVDNLHPINSIALLEIASPIYYSTDKDVVKNFDFSKLAAASLTIKLESKNYQVTQFPVNRKNKNKLLKDYNDINIPGVDAYLDVAPMFIGYIEYRKHIQFLEAYYPIISSSQGIWPVVGIVVRLVSANTKEIIYAETFLHGATKPASPVEHYRSYSELWKDAGPAASHLVKRIEAITQEIANKLSKQQYPELQQEGAFDGNLSIIENYIAREGISGIYFYVHKRFPNSILTLVQDGNKITGSSDDGMLFLEGTIKGDTIKFDWTQGGSIGDGISSVYSSKIISGKWRSIGGNSYDWVLRKISTLPEQKLELVFGESEYLFLGKAAEEITSESYDKVLWGKALALAGGDEQKRNGIYIKLRFEQLANRKKYTDAIAKLEANQSNQAGSGTNITGTYISEITGVSNKSKERYSKLKIVQNGNKITGSFEKDQIKVEGTIEGDSFEIYWMSPGGGNWEIKFKVSPDNQITGKYWVSSISGQWNLIPLDKWIAEVKLNEQTAIEQAAIGQAARKVEIQYLGKAAEEITSESYDKVLWGKALAPAGGDEQKRNGIYIKLRFEQLALEKKNAHAIANLNVNQNSQSVSGPDITGTYVSEITSNHARYFRKKYRKLVITFKQDGNSVTASDNTYKVDIWGTREGKTIFFDMGTNKMNDFQGTSGKWKINVDGTRLEGSWEQPTHNASGKWNLTRIQ